MYNVSNMQFVCLHPDCLLIDYAMVFWRADVSGE